MAQGEAGYETDTGKLKIGDGATAWNSLAYQAAANIVDDTIVDDDVNASAAIAGTKISPDFGSQTVETTGVFSAAGGAEATPSITFTGDLDTGIYSPGADQVAISTNGTGRLFVDANGQVGINTTPSYRLDVNTGANNRVRITDTGSATLGLVRTGAKSYLIQSLGDSALRVYDETATSERLRITSDGKLGLGTSSPSANLDVTGISGTYPTQQIRHSAVDTDGEFLRIARTDNATIRHHSVHARHSAGGGAGDNYLQFKIHSPAISDTGQNTVLHLDGAGRVGIGTTSPSTLLDVAGGARIGAQNTSTLPASNGGGGAHFFFNRSAGDAETNIVNLFENASLSFQFLQKTGASTANVLYSFASSGHFWAVDNTERARIDSSGRLLVGMSSDSGGSLLQVNDDRIRIASSKTPASASDTGTAGEICWDADYIYVCTATDTWKRTAISTW
jgi:hypothetical protein